MPVNITLCIQTGSWIAWKPSLLEMNVFMNHKHNKNIHYYKRCLLNLHTLYIKYSIGISMVCKTVTVTI